MAKLSVRDLDLNGKRVLVRVDFNVPVKDGKVTDDTRIKASLPTIKYIVDKGGKAVLVSHLGRPDGKADMKYTLKPVAGRLQELIGKQPDFSYWDKTPNVKSVEQDIKLRREHGIKQTLAYAEHALKSPWRIHKYPELGGSITLGDIVVRWTADVVLEWPDGQLTVRDIKTGNKGNVKSNLQLGIYKLGLQENFGIEVTQGEFWFTKDGTSGGYDNLQRYTRSYIEDLFVSLERGIAGKVFLPNPGSHCKFCGVKPFCRELGVIGNVPTSR